MDFGVPPEIAALPYVPISPEERRRRVKEARDKVKESVVKLQNSAVFREYLLASARFHNYSWGNQMLIWIQRPTATRVAGFNTWRDLGRHVKRGETGIEILAPLGPTSHVSWYRASDGVYWTIQRGEGKGWDVHDQEDQVVQSGFPSWAAASRWLKGQGFIEKREALVVNNFKVVHVFDISQTEGKPLPMMEMKELSVAMNRELWDGVLGLAKSEGVTVDFDEKEAKRNQADGFFRRPKFIWVNPTRNPATQLNALLHEFAHYNTADMSRIDRADAETTAECVACVVGAFYGFDTGASSFPYVAVWAKTEGRLDKNLDGIQEVSQKIIDELEKRKGMLFPMTDLGKTGADYW